MRICTHLTCVSTVRYLHENQEPKWFFGFGSGLKILFFSKSDPQQPKQIYADLDLYPERYYLCKNVIFGTQVFFHLILSHKEP